MMRSTPVIAVPVLMLGGVAQARADMFHFIPPGSIQTFAVPTTGLYDITVAGAQGGNIASTPSAGAGE